MKTALRILIGFVTIAATILTGFGVGRLIGIESSPVKTVFVGVGVLTCLVGAVYLILCLAYLIGATIIKEEE